jgi:hypothetical protein
MPTLIPPTPLSRQLAWTALYTERRKTERKGRTVATFWPCGKRG